MQQSLDRGADAHTFRTAQPNPQIRPNGDHLFGGATLAIGAQPSQGLLFTLNDVVVL
jgi:hypothetical protein